MYLAHMQDMHLEDLFLLHLFLTVDYLTCRRVSIYKSDLLRMKDSMIIKSPFLGQTMIQIMITITSKPSPGPLCFHDVGHNHNTSTPSPMPLCFLDVGHDHDTSTPSPMPLCDQV